MIQLRLFGTVELRADDTREVRSVVLQPKRLALLAYLAAAPGGRHRRDTLLAVFWPELDAVHARGALSKSVHYLRRSLGESVIVSHGDEELSVAAEQLWCDVAAFTGLLDEGRAAEALAVYRGDLLQGFFITEAPDFERWLDQEREQYRRHAAAAAWTLADEAESNGNLTAAVDWARRACTIAGEDEAALRRLLTLQIAAGDRSGAVRLYEEFTRRLAADYGLEPTSETQHLIAGVREPTVSRSSPPAAATGREIVRPLAPPPETVVTPAPPAPPLPRRAGRLAILATVAIAVIGAWAYLQKSRPAAADFALNRVVVAPLDNRTGVAALDPLGNMAADWIIQGLAQTGLVEVVPFTATLTSSRRLVGLLDDHDTAERIRTLGHETGARIVVTGSYYLQDDSLHLHARIIDVASDRVLHALEPVSTSSAKPLAAVAALRQQVMAGLAPHLNPRISRYASLTTPTPSYDAYREYAEGVERFIASDWRGAVGHFTRASAYDTTYTLPLVLAAIAYANMGDYASVDSLGRLIEPRRDRLAEYDRQAITAALAWTRGDYNTSYRAARRVAELAPNTMPHAQVARELLMVNRPREALRVLDELDPDRGELRGWFPYWNNLAAAHHMLGNFRSELNVAEQISARFPDTFAALQLQPRALAARGRLDDALACLEDHLARLGQQQTAAILMRLVALELDAHGRGDAARLLLERSLAWFLQPPPDVASTPAFRRALGEALYLAGELDRAQDALGPLAGEWPDDLALAGRLGTLAARRGDRVTAERISARLAALERPYLLGAHTLWRARIAALLDDQDAAVDLVRDAFAQGRTEWIALHTDPDLAALRGNRRFRELLRAKG